MKMAELLLLKIPIHLNHIQLSNSNEWIARPRGFKTFFMLNSAEYEFFSAHNC